MIASIVTVKRNRDEMQFNSFIPPTVLILFLRVIMMYIF